MIAQRLGDRIAQRSHSRENLSGFEYLIADRAALERIGIKQRLGTALTSMHHGELPGQIKDILHPSIHPLAAGGTVNVSGIASQHDSTAPVLGDFAFVNAQIGEPHGIAQDQPAWAALVYFGLSIRQRGIRSLNRGIRFAEIGYHAKSIASDRKENQRALGV